MEKLKDLSEIKHKLIDAVKMELDKGVESADTEELGEVVDMIKDLASAEKDCMEASYYELVCEAMDDGESERMGYDRWRYSSGRFAPKGRGSRTYGYLPSPNYRMDERENVDGYTRNGETYGNVNGNSANRSMGRRYGYHGEPKEKLDEAMEVMGDVWAEADSDLKDRMKKSLKDLLYQMEQSA